MSAAERASEASRALQAKEWAVRANKRTDERVAQYFSHFFWIVLAHRAPRKEDGDGAAVRRRHDGIKARTQTAPRKHGVGAPEEL